jgi:hypothetical protein
MSGEGPGGYYAEFSVLDQAVPVHLSGTAFALQETSSSGLSASSRQAGQQAAGMEGAFLEQSW